MKLKLLTAILVSTLSMAVLADNTHSIQIKTTPLNNNVYMIEGQGGNIAVIENNDALYVVDKAILPIAVS